ncbi:C4-dicarboxylate ABC transporter substrate-binding protein [Roseibium denhamense]|uniref:TRAP-type C4-dicarboxylate transport system, substrate-binding protein n=1 Tax=Roseibium denhamense TaxID=76305 RepID=A0ABY1P2M4_9HYPH|nr:C4-dicarboxylate TRAP transporter substrate-binding protein [Roseibium denhamense]MTI07623.1 C4-dicarboxylate ABC transporter substrate-binding protein [Roseibium denhamense]SMP24167.1 TRAP-type C4-dicarboxylate transport system, substrate-binding protein [Roseibium denhamense]
MLTKLKFATAVSAGTLGLIFATETFAADVTWNVSLWGKRRAFTEHVEKLAEEVKARTNGAFEIKLHYGGALSKSRENLDGISFGAFEMAQFCASYHADKNPTLTVLELPFLGVSDLETEVKVSKALYEHPAVQQDLGRWNAKLLMPSPMPQYNFAGKGDVPASISDFEGMRVRALGGLGKLMEAAGAVPTSVTASETYQAIDSGTVQAAGFAPHAHLSFKVVEVADWWTKNLNPGTVHCPVVVNVDAYNALSDEFKAALDESVDPAIAHYLDTYAAVYDKWWPELENRGITQIEFSDDELASFSEKAGPIHAAWVEEQSANGLPAQEILDMVKKTIAE